MAPALSTKSVGLLCLHSVAFRPLEIQGREEIANRVTVMQSVYNSPALSVATVFNLYVVKGAAGYDLLAPLSDPALINAPICLDPIYTDRLMSHIPCVTRFMSYIRAGPTTPFKLLSDLHHPTPPK